MLSPKDLWDYCLELQALIRSNAAHDLFQLDSEVPSTWMGNGTTDISAICGYGWYEWVLYYREEKAAFPHDSEILGRYLGPAPDIGGGMCMCILNATGKVHHRSTIRHLTPAELLSEESKAASLAFDAAIAVSRGPAFTKMDFTDGDTPNFEPYADKTSGDASSNRMPEADEYDHDAFDKYLSTEVILPTVDHMLRGRVKSRKRDANGNPVGRANSNPILDTRLYNVEFPDGHIAAYAANVIAKNMYTQVDE